MRSPQVNRIEGRVGTTTCLRSDGDPKRESRMNLAFREASTNFKWVGIPRLASEPFGLIANTREHLMLTPRMGHQRNSFDRPFCN